jgi:hypothetical protein
VPLRACWFESSPGHSKLPCVVREFEGSVKHGAGRPTPGSLFYITAHTPRLGAVKDENVVTLSEAFFAALRMTGGDSVRRLCYSPSTGV